MFLYEQSLLITSACKDIHYNFDIVSFQHFCIITSYDILCELTLHLTAFLVQHYMFGYHA